MLIVGQIRGVKLSVRDILLVVGVKIGERKWVKVLDYGGMIWYNTLMDEYKRKCRQYARRLCIKHGFKIGDKVKCVAECRVFGEIGEVVGYGYMGDCACPTVRFLLANENGKQVEASAFFRENELEKVSEV